ELREELDAARAQGKDTDRLKERIEGLEERIARREEALQSVRDRIASVPVLERRIREIDSLLRAIMIPILQARIGERQAELDSLNARVEDLERNAPVKRTLKQQQFIDELQTRRDNVERALNRLRERLTALTAPPVTGPPSPGTPPAPPGGPPAPP